jgi:hypothetical protein
MTTFNHTPKEFKIIPPPMKGKRKHARNFEQTDAVIDFLLRVCINLQERVEQLEQKNP